MLHGKEQEEQLTSWKNNIPFVFCSYYSKLDKSALEKSKKIPPPRKPGALFVILYLALTLKYSTPAFNCFL